MKHKQKVAINRLLKSVAGESDLSKRIEQLSVRFLGLPYLANSLIGGIETPEQLVVKLDAFDCVTYLETILALALSETAEQFEENLIRLRYKNGEVSWATRNHYMVDWWRNNERQGLIKNMTAGKASNTKKRELNLIPGLPTKRVSFQVFTKRNLAQVKKLIKTGDFAFFGTTKKNLDVFHSGILIEDGKNLLLRHATRKLGAVVEQNFIAFLNEHRMSGFVLLRPIQR
jgi:hypothetical protein